MEEALSHTFKLDMLASKHANNYLFLSCTRSTPDAQGVFVAFGICPPNFFLNFDLFYEVLNKQPIAYLDSIRTAQLPRLYLQQKNTHCPESLPKWDTG